MALEAEQALINDLNVFPVPDGDTGTNMVLTLRAAAAAADEQAESEGLAAAIERAALIGAQGNSGVILSQVIRGLCQGFGGAPEPLSAATCTAALQRAAEFAYRAPREPVEGTMLSVIGAMGRAAAAAPADSQLGELAALVEAAAVEAVVATTSQLPMLAAAGVVDAGGYGLLVLLRGLIAGLAAEGLITAEQFTPLEIARPGGSSSSESTLESALPPGHDGRSQHRYCTNFLVVGGDRQALEDYCLAAGDSVVVVADEGLAKVHVHTDDPGAVLSAALQQGSIDDVEIKDMHKQTRQRAGRLAEQRLEHRPTAVVAVVAGEGNKEAFRQLGCTAIVDGGATMNPSAADLLAAIEGVAADGVIVLPNDGNIVIAADQAATMATRPVSVLSSTSLPAGLAAMVVFEPEADLESNAETMAAALAEVRSGSVTFASRSASIDGFEVSCGQALGLVDGRLVAATDDISSAIAAVFSEFHRSGAEYVTVLTALNGHGVTHADLAALAARTMADAELRCYEGGQPHYPLLASAE